VTAFSTRTTNGLTANEWTTFKAILTAADEVNAAVSIVEHVGRCSMCEAEASARTASIRIEWAGRPLSREYTLETT
jgi:hypothetical protein